MATLLQPSDFDGVKAMADLSAEEITREIESAEAIAKALYVPTLHNANFPHKEAAKGIIRKAIIYDVEARGKQHQMQSAGQYQVTNFAPTRSGTFYSASQVEALRALRVQWGLPAAYSVAVTRR